MAASRKSMSALSCVGLLLTTPLSDTFIWFSFATLYDKCVLSNLPSSSTVVTAFSSYIALPLNGTLIIFLLAPFNSLPNAFFFHIFDNYSCENASTGVEVYANSSVLIS